ncbi:hypothetical protein [Lysobacter gummosus]|uniref:hypothetical protein n=1 Tax=Lysobacter gummosus TaxID=262324 RepID=UPI00363D5481
MRATAKASHLPGSPADPLQSPHFPPPGSSPPAYRPDTPARFAGTCVNTLGPPAMAHERQPASDRDSRPSAGT